MNDQIQASSKKSKICGKQKSTVFPSPFERRIEAKMYIKQKIPLTSTKKDKVKNGKFFL